MKKLLFLVSAVVCLSCSSNERSDDTSDTSGSIVGKWKLASSSESLSSCNLDNATYQFNSDLSAKETDGHMSGNDCIKSSYNEKYSLSGSVLIIKELKSNGTVNDQFTFQVLQLTTKTMKLNISGTTLTYSKID